MANHTPELSDELLFAVCEKFLNLEKPTQIAEWVEENGPPCTREQIYPLVHKALKQDFVRLNPPRDLLMAQQLVQKYPQAADVRVVSTRGSSAIEHLGSAAAELVSSLIKDLCKSKPEVHLGFGAGGSTQQVARQLGSLLRKETGLPKLVIHAMSSGFAVNDPLTAPIAFFSYFAEIIPTPGFVGLFAPAVVKYKEYDKVKSWPGVADSFKQAKKLDIVITSLARAEDEHGLLNRFLRDNNAIGLRNLERAGWVGDVQWRPYGKNGPITADTGRRAVTLFELDQLKSMVEKGKHVVLVAGPCGRCGESKSSALRPLLEQPDLRVANHLVTDIATVEKLLN